MERTVIIVCLLAIGLCFSSLQAQIDKPRVAVFDPAASGNSMDEGIAIAVREIISSVLVNTGNYNIVERSLLDKILSEQKLSNSGMVDASQVSELGRLVGANKAILTVLTNAGKRTVLSIKMVDVESANVETQKIKNIKPEELLDIIEPLTLEMIGEEVPVVETTKGFSLGGLFRKGETQPKEERKKEENKVSGARLGKKTSREEFVERNDEEKWFEAAPETADEEILLEFKGNDNRKNPTAQVFLDDNLIGEGTLNDGFHIKFKDSKPGSHTVRVEWSGTVQNATFKINTRKERYYRFEYATSGFGYAFKMIK